MPQSVEDLLASLGTSQDDRDRARQQFILATGLGLLGTRRGDEMPALSRAMQGGLLSQQGYLDNSQNQKLRALQMKGTALDYLSHQQQYNDAELMRQQQAEAARRFAPASAASSGGLLFNGAPGGGNGGGIVSDDTAAQLAGAPSASSPFTPPGLSSSQADSMRSMQGTVGPAVQNLMNGPAGASYASGPQQPPAASPSGTPGGAPNRRAMATRLQQLGDYWSSVGRMQQADMYYKAAQQAMPQLKDQKALMQNGQRVLVNIYNDGTHEIVTDVQPDRDKLHFADSGSAAGVGLDPYSGAQVTPGLPKTMTPHEQASIDLRRLEVDPFGTLSNAAKTGTPGGGAPGVSGDDFLQTIPKPMADQVRALAEGRMAFPAGFALKSPYWQNMISAVSQYDPSFDAINYNARSATRKDFTSGKSAQSLNALNTVMGHLDTFDKAAAALNNSGSPMWNTVANAVGEQVSPQLAGRLKQFNAAKQAAILEMERAYRQTGGSEGDLKQWRQVINSSDSPEAMRAAMQQMVELLGSKIGALGEQYNKGMGTTSEGLSLLTPKAQETFNRLTGNSKGDEPSRTSKAAPGGVTPGTTGIVNGRRVIMGADGKVHPLQ